MRHSVSSVALVTMCLWSGSAWTLDLKQAYAGALTHDAQFHAALKGKTAGLMYRELGFANLLPQVQFTYSNNNNQLQRTVTDGFGRPATDSPDYRSTSSALSLRQPLVNFEAMARYRQGLAQSDQSLAVFDSQTNALAIRLTEAYANVLLAMEQVALVQAESTAYEALMKANRALWKKGEGTRTDAVETRYRFLVSQAQLAEANGSLDTARRQLEGIVGADMRGAIADMRNPQRAFRPQALNPSSVESWQALALDANPDIRALRHALEVARQDLRRAEANHLPRLDLVATLSRSTSETPTTINQRLRNDSTGVQLTVPLYSGGSVSAAIRQSSANHEKAQAELDARTNEVMVDLRKHFNLLNSGALKIAAFEEAVESAELQVDAMRKSIARGQRVNADLLTAIQQLATVRRDQAQARYAYVNSWVRVNAHTKRVGEDDIGQLAAFFAN